MGSKVMTTIGWMLTRMIVTRFLGILFGIAIFVLTLEVISPTPPVSPWK